LEQVLQELAVFYPQIEQRITVDWQSLSSVHMSGQALKIVLFNVIENALKHAHSREKIQVRQQQQVVIIEDFGIGLTPQDLTLATQRFWRKSAQTQGYGLGLALTQALMHQYGYQLSIRSKAQGGLLVELGFKSNVDQITK